MIATGTGDLLSPFAEQEPGDRAVGTSFCRLAGFQGSAADVRFGSLADIIERTRDVRLPPKSRHAQRRHQCPLRATSRHEQFIAAVGQAKE
jgi:hypothetical protein